MTKKEFSIVLVDDDPKYADLIKHQLRTFHNKSFNVAWISDASTVLSFLKSGKVIDLILMDYFLPGTNGIEIIKKIYEEKIRVPIILLTSNRDFKIAIEAMKYGVEDYILKEDAANTLLPRSIINIIERFELARRIEQAEKEETISKNKIDAIQQLVVTMCHEFNNPLAAIKISSDILSRHALTSEQKQVLAKLNNDISLLEKQIVKLRDLNMK
jgi:response regulator of citrate/malate metabolism